MGAVRATFSQEAVREFQVLVNSYSAEFGKASGGVINIVTKSGTNVLHGSGFLFFRDRTLNATNHFDKFDTFGRPVSLESRRFASSREAARSAGRCGRTTPSFSCPTRERGSGTRGW
jgi:hypothetical protein